MFWNRILYLVLCSTILLFSCSDSSSDDIIGTPETPVTPKTLTYSGVDISYYPSIAQKNLTFKNREGNAQSFLTILRDNGVNTIRLRLWHTPTTDHASFAEVKSFSSQLKSMGFNVWLTVHYSDTWADPGKQQIPAAWQNASYEVLKDSVYNYTSKIISEIGPDIIQVGNEVDPGMLLPVGDINTNRPQFLGLLNEGIQAVRDRNSATKIMIHKADPGTAQWFFDIVKDLDYDLMGVSYYPRWHGKDLNTLKSQLQLLSTSFPQDLILAETSYPFSLGWVDLTNNVIGSNSQIIFPEYPASPQGQKDFLSDVKDVVLSIDKGIGLGYWGAEWVAFEGPNATITGSPWENQALFDFNLQATPALEVFKNE